jgi:starch synthase
MLRQMKARWKRPKKTTEGDTSSNTNHLSSNIQVSNVLLSSLICPEKWCRQFGSYISNAAGLLAQELKREGCTAILCQDYEYARF